MFLQRNTALRKVIFEVLDGGLLGERPCQTARHRQFGTQGDARISLAPHLESLIELLGGGKKTKLSSASYAETIEGVSPTKVRKVPQDRSRVEDACREPHSEKKRSACNLPRREIERSAGGQACDLRQRALGPFPQC